MAIARESGERESSSSIDCNACHQIGGVGSGGFGARQYIILADPEYRQTLSKHDSKRR